MTDEQLAYEAAKAIVGSGVEGGYDALSCSTGGNYISIGCSQWEGPRGDRLLRAVGLDQYIGCTYTDLRDQGCLQTIKDAISSPEGQAFQLKMLSEDTLGYIQAQKDIPNDWDSRTIIYIATWQPTSTTLPVLFLQHRIDRVDIQDLWQVKELFRNEYYIAAGYRGNETIKIGYANRAQNAFYYVAAIDLTTPYGVPEYKAKPGEVDE